MSGAILRFLAALVFAAAANTGIAATIQLVGGTGFSDTTIVSPEGGNTGTTLGQQRTILFQAAANVWGAALSSSQTIKVNATFTALACTATAGTLGAAGAATNIVLNVDTKQRYFAVALAEALVGFDINGTGVAEINANFNSRVDQNDTSCLGSTRFYYGLTGPAPAGTIALYPVVLHELGHGLGFAPVLCRVQAGCTGPTTAFGGYFNNIPDIWSEFMRDNNAGGTGANRHWVDMTTAERAASITNDPSLVWNGMSVTTNLGSQAAVARNEGRLRLYAPGTYVQGSSVAHFHSDASPNLLMEPSLNSDVFTQTDLTDCLFQDIGWDDSRCALVLNNAPTLNAIADPPAIDEDAGQQTVNLSGIGDGDTLAQIVSITAVSNNPALIPNPAVNYVDPNTTGTLTYTPVANQSGSATITVTARDDGDSAYVPNSSTRTFTVTVNAVNDAPQATNLSTPETYTEDTTLDLADIVVSDIDSTTAIATLMLAPASAGSLTTGTVGSASSTYDAGSGVWSASGTLADVNGLLAGVAFVPTANGTAAATIATSITDGLAPPVTGNKMLAANAVNDAPQLTNTVGAQTYVEDVPLDLANVVIADPDSATLTVTLQLTPTGLGSLTTGTVGGATSTYQAATGLWQGSGPIADLQQLLDAVVFVPTPDGNASGTLAITVSDGIAPAVSGARTLTGAAVNDPPQATNVSTAETYTEDTTRELVDIVASDVDATSLTATLTLSAPAAGRLTTGTFGGTTSHYAPAGGAWSVSGPIANVNALLASVAFVPAANYDASFTIGVAIDDGLLSVLGTKTMTGVAVNDAPQATNLSAGETYTEDTPLDLVDIVTADVDSATLTVQLTLSPVSAGSLTTGTAGSTTSTYTAATGRWSATGPIAELNALLANVSFVPTPDGSVTATLATSVDDGVAAAVTGSKTLTGVPVNDPPTLDAITGPLPIPPNAGTQTVTLTGIGAGPGESQVLTVTAMSSNPSVIPHPTVSYASPGASGSISFAPAHNAIGTATITVTVTDDGGGANSISRSFVQQVGVDVIFINGFE
jgi:hypothetical protein